MTTFVRGRVVDTEGRPVAGAKVFVDASHARVAPDGRAEFCAVTNAAGEYAFTTDEHIALRKMDGAALALRAIDGLRVSPTVVFPLNTSRPRKAPDVVVAPGVMGRVVAQWIDGAPAAGVAVQVTLQEPPSDPEDDKYLATTFEGETDAHGELAFGPVRDQEFKRIILRGSHPDAPTRVPWWDDRRLDDRAPLELSLPRGQVVRGRLLTASGEPAAGYRVAPLGGETGDPEAIRVVLTDSEGRFEVGSVDPREALIAFYDKPAPPSSDPRGRLLHYIDRVGGPRNALLFHDVPAGQDDLGTVSLPTLGTLTLSLEPSRSGRVHWWHAGHRHGTRASQVEPGGIVRLRRVPLGIAIDVQVNVVDSRHGRLEQRFRIDEVVDGSLALRVTGAGTVIVRLHPAGAPEEELWVRNARAEWSEYHGLAHRKGPLPELRGWAPPDFYPELTIRAQGFRERVLESVEVRRDGPTYVDVELEPH